MRGANLGRCRHLPGLTERMAVIADGLAVDGNLLMSAGFVADGAVCLEGAEIGRCLALFRGEADHAYGVTLSAVGVHVKSALKVGAVCTPKVNISLSARASNGDLDAEGGTVRRRGLERPAPSGREGQRWADGVPRDQIKVSGFSPARRDVGERNSGADLRQIGGDLDCGGRTLQFPRRDPSTPTERA